MASTSSGARSVSIVVQPTSLYHSMYDDCSCGPMFFRLSTLSSSSHSHEDNIRLSPPVASASTNSTRSASVDRGHTSASNKPTRLLLSVVDNITLKDRLSHHSSITLGDQYVPSCFGYERRDQDDRYGNEECRQSQNARFNNNQSGDDVSDASSFTSSQHDVDFKNYLCTTDDVSQSSTSYLCSNQQGQTVGETSTSPKPASAKSTGVRAPERQVQLARESFETVDEELSRESWVEEQVGVSPCVEGESDSHLQDVSKGNYVNRVVDEIIETERTYVRDLGHIIQGYLKHLLSSQLINITPEDIRVLFGNVEYICDFNSRFLVELEMCSNNPVNVAKCFVKQTEGFVIYSEYCSNYPRSLEVLTRCMKDPDIAMALKRQQLVLKHGLPLGSYLLKPVQRILKYHLLLQNILDNYEENDRLGRDVIQHALDGMVDVATRINEMKRQHERVVRIQEIQSRLYGWHGNDLTTLGDLILEDKFRMSGARERRQIFLFDKALFIAKKKPDGLLLVKSFIECCNLMLIETVTRQPLSFQLVPFDSPRIQFTVQASKIEQKRLWCQHIRRLIVSEYNSTTTQQLLMTSCAMRHVRKECSTIDRLMRKQRRRLTGILSGQPVLKVTLPTASILELEPSAVRNNERPFDTQLDSLDDTTFFSSVNNICDEKQCYFDSDEAPRRTSEVLPWSMPDLLLNHSNAQPEDNCEQIDNLSLHQTRECAINASQIDGGELSLPSKTDATLSTRDEINSCPIGDDVNVDDVLSVTLDPTTLCLERPLALKRRDSIALRKSKLRHVIVGGACSRLQRQNSQGTVRSGVSVSRSENR